jgi:YD repeat-containing protein
VQKLLITFILFSGSVFAQNFIEFPVLGDGIPTEAVKGPVHTVLTIKQKGEYVFDTTVVIYDKKGRIVESLSSNANIEDHSGELVRGGGKEINTYDGTGKVVRVSKFEPGGELLAFDRYIYDDKGRLIEITFFNAKGESTGWERINYSPNKKELEVTWIYLPLPISPQVPSTWRSTLTYDEKGRWTKRTEFRNGEWTTGFEYDKAGAFVKDIHNGWNHTYTYKYDGRGNWIERVRTYHDVDDASKTIPDDMHYYRTISYYPDATPK